MLSSQVALDLEKVSFIRVVGALYVLYLAGLVFYRLFLSPLSKFPGPKLAASTQWYEFYYDVVLGGQFTFQIQRLHKQYGPIVRINPFELHVEDSSYWDELYTGHKDYERYRWIIGRFGVNTNTSTTVGSEEHASRRAPLNPLFSKRSIAQLHPVVVEKIELLARRIATFQKSGQPLALNNAFNAFSGDVITTYCFGDCFDHLKSAGFAVNFHPAFEGVRKLAHLGLQIPMVFLAVGLCPGWVIRIVAPGVYQMRILQKDLRFKVASQIEARELAKTEHPTILSTLMNSKLSAKEKTVNRLTSEIRQLIGAGVETVAWALTTTMFHLLDNPEIMQRLRLELESAMPDPNSAIQIPRLEQLPYLSAVVKEGLRLATGVSVRLPRVSPTGSMKYKDWEIPTGTPVSMTTLDALRDAQIYQEPASFVPERWLNESAVKNDSQNPNRGFVPFGKGPRMCLGVNLAYAELFPTLAVLVRCFTFELYDTDYSDVEIKHDFMVPQPKLSSKGVRVKVKSVLRQVS